MTDPLQASFLDETVRCLEAGAYRAAIVMGWNLAYDHIRRWIFDNHLAAFNTELVTKKDRKGRLRLPVVNIEDFPHGEDFVISLGEKLSLLGGQKKLLDAALERRNRFAHPSSHTASAPVAAGHIADLLQHVVLNAHFS